MSWNFREHDQRDEITELRKQLSVQEARFANVEDQLLKKSEAYQETKDALDDALLKLQREASAVLELERTLTRRNEELQSEKLHRENSEAALHNLRNELKQGDSTSRELHVIIERLSHDVDEARGKLQKASLDKSKLEARVCELEAEAKSKFAIPVVKMNARPRSSSLTHLNVKTMERDLEQLRASASSSRSELENLKSRLAKAQSDLVRVENENLVLAKKASESDKNLKQATEELSEKEEELEHLRMQSGSAEREAQLLARLEEEEQMVELLERQLSGASRAGETNRQLDHLQAQLDSEIARRESCELRQVELAREREEALNGLDDCSVKLQQLSQSLDQRERRIRTLEDRESELIQQLQRQPPITPATQAEELDECSVANLLSAIDRLRSERDRLRFDIEYLQTETRFAIESLQIKLADGDKADKMQVDGEVVSTVREDVARLRSELQTCNELLASGRSEGESLREEPFTMRANLEANAERLEQAFNEKQELLSQKDRDIAMLMQRLSEASSSAEDATDQRDRLAQETDSLQAKVSALQQELVEAKERHGLLQSVQTMATSEDATISVLKENIRELESRVHRRTEQIGVHQHDIKRLETNLRLAEDRLGELSSELEMANTEKAAMLEDCATAREDRDEARKAKDDLEVQVDELYRKVAEGRSQLASTQARLEESYEIITGVEAARAVEVTTLVEALIERECRLRTLSLELRTAKRRRLLEAANSPQTDDIVATSMDTDVSTSAARQNTAVTDNLERVLQVAGAELQTSTSLASSLEERAAVTLVNVNSLETAKAELESRLLELEKDYSAKLADSSKLCTSLEVERRDHAAEIERLAGEYKMSKAELESQLQGAEDERKELREHSLRIEAQLLSARQELQQQHHLCEELRQSHHISNSALADELAELKGRLQRAESELEEVRTALERESSGRRLDLQTYEADMKASLEKNELVALAEAQLRHDIRQYQEQLRALQEKIDVLKNEIASKQSDVDNLTEEVHRAQLQSRSFAGELASSEQTLAKLRDELVQVREALAHSEKSGKAVEMDLLLKITQNERIISTLQYQAKTHESDIARIQNLEQTIGELKEQIKEKDELLRAKCAEIEENDDKFIALFKENNKLTKNVESLTRKNANLQKKLTSVSAMAKATIQAATMSPPPVPSASSTPPVARLTVSAQPPLSVPTPGPSTVPLVPRQHMPEVRQTPQENPAEVHVFRPRTPELTSLPTPPPQLCAAQPEASSSGKKRRVPDDFNPSEPLPAQPIVVDTTTTPRPRKPLRTLRSGFTPIRGLGGNARPTLCQPSPLKRMVSPTSQPGISDVTNASSKRTTSQAKASRSGWLGKIRAGAAANPLANAPDRQMLQEDFP